MSNIIKSAYDKLFGTASSCSRVIKFEHRDSKKKVYKILYCGSSWCPTCSGLDGRLHKRRLESTLRRLPIDQIVIRQFIFTVPEELRDHFKSRKHMNSFFGITQRCIERYFGELKESTSKKKECKYQVYVGAVAYLHLFGESSKSFHPHINVHIILKRSDFVSELTFKLSISIREAIKESYRRALKRYVIAKMKLHPSTDPELFDKIAVADVHYSDKCSQAQVENAIRYMTKPPDLNGLRTWAKAASDIELARIIMAFHRFRHIRFWGMLCDTKWKEYFKILTDVEAEPASESHIAGYRKTEILTLEEFRSIRAVVREDPLSYIDSEVEWALKSWPQPASAKPKR